MKKLGANKKVKIAAGFGGETGTSSHELLPQGSFLNVPVDALKPNPYQPRQVFNQEELEALAESIRHQGVITPLCIFVEKDQYFIGGGERRWRASKLAGKATVPCYVTTGSPAEIGLIENMFRQDLTPMEEAEAYARMQKEFKYTHQDLARVVGKSRNNITETLGLNKLPETIREKCLRVDISKRALIAISRMETPEAMEAAFNQATGIKTNETDEPKQPKAKISKATRATTRVEKLTDEIRKVNLTECKPDESAALVLALRDLKTELERLPNMALSMMNQEAGPEEPLNLTGSCRVKLLRAGFRIFRTLGYGNVIKELSHTGGWKLVSKHKTKKAMNEALEELLRDPMCVRD